MRPSYPQFSLRLIAWMALIWSVLFHPTPTEAASLTTLRNYLVRQQANLASGQIHQFFFTPGTSLPGSGNTLVLEFPISNTGNWCHTAGDLTVSGLVDPEGSVEGATALPGSLTAVCTGGNTTTIGDRLTVSAIGPLTAGIKYGVRLSEGVTGRLGTSDAANNILVNVKTTDGVLDVDAGFFWLAVLDNDRVTITATVTSAPAPTNNPAVQFRGRASIGTNVLFHRDTITDPPMHSVATDPAAKFDVTLTNQPTGQHIYIIEATDTLGRPHASMTFALNLTAGSTTLITGVFLGPTIEVDRSEVSLGEIVTVFGKTAPNSTVTLTIESDPVTYNFTADAQGDWSKAVNSNDTGVGDHTATAVATSTDNTTSETSQPATFAVNPLGLCAGRSTADLNCDGRVNLTDFSILLFFWQSSNPSNTRADVNGSGQVTIVDFSIMLFQWTN